MSEMHRDESLVREIMEGFAARTGLSPEGPQRRYLWTDAFALCNYLTLLRRTREPRFRDLALLLVDRVHHVLGRHRPDDPREGWISGLDEEQGERRPTAGGLRIGKELAERGGDEPYDPASEWDRDGQYYHYLVRWMHGLALAADALEEPRLHAWAVELARTAHAGFAYGSGGGPATRLYWKMSVDLTRPLVPSQGAHDPLDGFVATSALRADELRGELDELWRMCRPAAWPTDDPLGIGGLLTDAWWVAQLLGLPDADADERLRPLLHRLVDVSLVSLEAFARVSPLRRPLQLRLAFRELGLAIGLRACQVLLGAAGGPAAALDRGARRGLARHLAVADDILETWSDPAARRTGSWKAHEDINDVMLATALAPDEFIRV